MQISKKLALIFTFTCLFWLLPAQAQETDGVASGVLITPKAGHEETLITAITEYHHWIAQFEGHMEYTWYEILTGPHTGKYMARSGNHNWADFDAEYDWQEESGKVFASNIAPHIESMHRTMTEEMREYSHWPESFDGYTHFTVENWYIKNGHGRKFRTHLKKIVETLKANGFKNYWGFFDVVTGGHGGQVQLVSANKGWADMADTDPSFYDIMSKELGGDEAFNAFMSEWGATFKSGANWTVKRMPEASDYGK
ncbi:MAG: hypothetical protein OES53_09150 [Xanthomonadales bacterium]|jgi:hypothetical protein|nr:hypothetical protein [Xanthomonadales bacterium]MDH3925046.1 hypothetical protein [Xanthomonadales bacterium]MDH4000159.1 hypothetical protein [Xanthomonadales bacterium]